MLNASNSKLFYVPRRVRNCTKRVDEQRCVDTILLCSFFSRCRHRYFFSSFSNWNSFGLFFLAHTFLQLCDAKWNLSLKNGKNKKKRNKIEREKSVKSGTICWFLMSFWDWRNIWLFLTRAKQYSYVTHTLVESVAVCGTRIRKECSEIDRHTYIYWECVSM